MSDFSEQLNRIRARPSVHDLLTACVDYLAGVIESAFAQARFDVPQRFAELRAAVGRGEIDRGLTMAEELEQLVKREDLFLGRYPAPRPRELALVRGVLHELGELSDDRLYGDIDDEQIVHATLAVQQAWQLFTDASSGFFSQGDDRAG